jgi:hypothetical protein
MDLSVFTSPHLTLSVIVARPKQPTTTPQIMLTPLAKHQFGLKSEQTTLDMKDEDIKRLRSEHFTIGLSLDRTQNGTQLVLEQQKFTKNELYRTQKGLPIDWRPNDAEQRLILAA